MRLARALTKRRSERGAVLVEAAIATPLIVLLFLSVAWGGLLFRSSLSVEHAAKVGARAGSVAGASSNADYQILQAIKTNTTALTGGQVRKVLVYQATGFEQAPPPSCLDGATTNCNYYVGSDLDLAQDSFGGDNNKPDKNFSPSSRSSQRSVPKYIGVYVESTAGVPNVGLPTPATLSHYQVLKLEASSY